MLSLIQDGTNPGHNSKIRFAKDMMTRLLILSCMTFWAGGMLSAEPALAPHRRKSFQKGVDELAQYQLFQKQRIQRVRNTNQRVEALIRTVNRKVPEWAFKN